MTLASDEAPLRALSRLRRAQHGRGLVAPADTLHRARRCPACGALALDASAFEEWLTPGGVGTPPVDDCDALAHALASTLDAPVEAACDCDEGGGAPALVRYAHAMGRADLVLEHARGRWTLRRVFLDGAEETLDGLDDAAVRAAFGRPLTLRPLWRAALAHAAAVSVERGHWLVADDARAPTDRALVAVVDAVAITAPAWTWLRAALAAGRHTRRALAAVYDRDTLHETLALHLARAGIALSPDADEGTWTAQRDEATWTVEPAQLARDLVALDLPLASGAARLAAQLDQKLREVTDYVTAVRALRPSVSFAVRGAQLWAEHVADALPLDLRSAPFELGLDDARLERDLRAHLGEHPTWGDRTRVCACGAPRLLVSRLVPAAALAAWHDAGRDVVVRRALDARSVFEVVMLECDRHREPASRAGLDAAGYDAADLDERLRADRAWVTFRFRASLHRDAEGRAGVLAQGPDLASVTLHGDWARGLVDAVVPGGARGAWHVEAWSPHSVVAYARDLDAALRGLLVGADAMLDPLAYPRGPAALAAVEVDAQVVGRGRFVRFDDDAAA